MLSPTAELSCLVISVQLRLLAKAPGLPRPSLLELAIGLAALAGLDATAVVDDAAADGEASTDDPIAADGAGPLLTLFEVHALSKPSAMHAALAAAAPARRWW